MLKARERRLTVFLRILSALFGLAVLGYLIPALGGPLQSFYVNLPFVTNSVVKVGVLALLAFFASGDVRRHRHMIDLIILAHLISILATIIVLLWGNTDYLVSIAGWVSPLSRILLGSVVLDGVIVVMLAWFFLTAQREEYGLAYLSPQQYRALAALAEVIVAREPALLTAEEVARNVDRYLAGFRAKTKWIMKLVLTGMEVYPLLSLRPPLSTMESSQRLRFLRRRFYQDVTLRLVPELWRTVVQGMIRMSKQLAYLGYYSDPRTFASVGYVPFSQRSDSAKRLRKSPEGKHLPLKVMTASEITGERLRGDVVIVGSGAAASVLAHGLATSGRQVLMLERGEYVDPSQFTEDEVEMISRLYADGALQLSRDFRFQVLQGSCVGGTTVVNNAVCFDIPDDVLNHWNDRDSLNAGIDKPGLMKSFKEVRQLLGVERQGVNLNHGAPEFLDGTKRLKLNAAPDRFGAIEANIEGCLGCGYCNIGCRYGKKLSMLDTLLPMTQRECGMEALRIAAGCEARKLIGRGTTVTAVRCRLSDGRVIDVEGKTIVLSAGAISSSLLLLRSGVAAERAGKRLSFNLGSPMTAVFDRVLNSYDGLQISHYLEPRPSRGFVIETWFNPPVAQALTMPGWFDDHFKNMLRYNRMTCTGVLVGTESNGVARLAGLTGREVDFTPTRGDLDKLLAGLTLSGEIFLEAGATCVIPNTFRYMEFTAADELRRLPELIRDSSDITLGTGHPQGGNVMSGDSSLGVVNPEFRVYGYDNLYVCDASVFPSSIGVNPQLTVMALAQYAVPFVAGPRG
ncbi:MAG: GMC family oxidoreductase [Bacteroidota bacterium]